MTKYRDKNGKVHEIEGDLFVTKDKNGKDVFAGDEVKMLKKRDFLEGEICEVGWSKYWNGYWLTCNKGNTDRWYGGWVKLIEDKEDE